MASTLNNIIGYVIVTALTLSQAQNWIHEGHDKNRVYICSAITLLSIVLTSKIFADDLVLFLFSCVVLGLVNYLVLYHDAV